jgi:hypothetical protein
VKEDWRDRVLSWANKTRPRRIVAALLFPIWIPLLLLSYFLEFIFVFTLWYWLMVPLWHGIWNGDWEYAARRDRGEKYGHVDY